MGGAPPERINVGMLSISKLKARPLRRVTKRINSISYLYRKGSSANNLGTIATNVVTVMLLCLILSGECYAMTREQFTHEMPQLLRKDLSANPFHEMRVSWLCHSVISISSENILAEAAAQEQAYQQVLAQADRPQKRQAQVSPNRNATVQPSISSPPVTTKPAETRGKYSNPYDRRVPLQGDTHKGYAPARRDPFKR